MPVAAANYSNQDSKLDFAPGIQDVERSGVESTTLAGQVGLAPTRCSTGWATSPPMSVRN
jgi:hypothetical protein